MVRALLSCAFVFAVEIAVSVGQPNPIDNAHYLLPAITAWTTPLPAASSNPGTLDDTHAYLPLDDGQLLALARDSGLVIWSEAVGALGRPVRTPDALLVPVTEGVAALDPATGERQWVVALPGTSLASLTAAGSGIIGMSREGLLVSIDPASRSVWWQQQLAESSNPVVAVAGERVYAAVDDGRFVALAATDGRVLWERTLPGRPTTAVTAAGRVYVGSTDNTFYALDAGTGSLAWRWRTGGDIVGAASDTHRVYSTALDNRLRAMDLRSGNQRWQAALPIRPSARPQVVGSAVVVTGIAPDVLVFDAVTGDSLGTYRAPAELAGPILVDPALSPYAVSIVGVTRTGQAIGLRSTGLQLAEPALEPLTTLPGVTVPLP